jgi:hypothetical protein
MLEVITLNSMILTYRAAKIRQKKQRPASGAAYWKTIGYLPMGHHSEIRHTAKALRFAAAKSVFSLLAFSNSVPF